jgi:hypothetical protein
MVEAAATIGRFWGKVALGRSDECWPWRCYSDRQGYGRLSGRRCRECQRRLSLETVATREPSLKKSRPCGRLPLSQGRMKMGSVKNHYHDEICAREDDDCGLQQDPDYGENERQRLDEKAAGEPVTKVGPNEPPHAAEGTTGGQSWEGAGLALGSAADTTGAEGAGEAHSPERIVLDVTTLRYVIGCLELQAQQFSTSKRSPVAAKLRSMAANWRSLIEECAQ